MKRRYINVSIVFFILLVVFFAGLTDKKYEVEKISKVKEVVIPVEPATVSQEKIEEIIADDNEIKISDKMKDINEKYEKVKTLVPSDYEQLEELGAEIKALNETIDANTESISSTNDVNETTLENLDNISMALDTIINTFNISN